MVPNSSLATVYLPGHLSQLIYTHVGNTDRYESVLEHLLNQKEKSNMKPILT